MTASIHTFPGAHVLGPILCRTMRSHRPRPRGLGRSRQRVDLVLHADRRQWGFGACPGGVTKRQALRAAIDAVLKFNAEMYPAQCLADEVGMAESAYDIARGYARRGWNPVPIPFRTKGPKDSGWQEPYYHRSDRRPLLQRRRAKHRRGAGYVVRRPHDDDLDCPEAIAAADDLLPDTAAIFGPAVEARARTGCTGRRWPRRRQGQHQVHRPRQQGHAGRAADRRRQGRAEPCSRARCTWMAERIAWDRDGRPRRSLARSCKPAWRRGPAAAVFIGTGRLREPA